MRLFWQKGRKIRSIERFKTSAILNARFHESYFKLKVNGRAVTSQTNKQPNVEVGSVWLCPQGNRPGKMSSSNNIKRISKQHIGMKLLFSSWALVYSPLLFHLSRALLGAWHFSLFGCVYSSFHYRLDLIREPFIGCFTLFSQFSLVCFIIM